MKAVNSITKTYSYDNDYMIDIVMAQDKIGAWLYHKDYCTKMFLWGCPREQQSYSEFRDLVEENIPDFIEDYQREFED